MAATNFDRLRAFARSRGVHVRRDHTPACWDRSERAIYIPKRLKGRDAVYVLLHEIGHMLVDASGRFDDVTVHVHEHARSWRGRALCVAEEWAAWDRGRRLARRLGISIDPVAYDNCAAQYLASYVHTAGTTPF